jgi:serine phosphatase RsbU (regulator of sigma subunit)
MTCFAAIIDVKKRLVTYANAGHIFPYLYREAAQQAGTQPQASSQSQAGVQPEASSQSQAAAQPQAGVQIQTGEAQGQFGCLMTRGNRLGDLAESKYAAKQMELLPGDLLVWYTDGLVECEGPNGEQYGEKRLRAAIRKVAQREPAAIRDTVLADAMQFFGERPRKDDVTMVIARVT